MRRSTNVGSDVFLDELYVQPTRKYDYLYGMTLLSNIT